MIAVQQHNVDIITINETWLREGWRAEGRAPFVPNYRLRHIPRPHAACARGGGVGFYVINGLTVPRCTHPPTPLHSTVEQISTSSPCRFRGSFKYAATKCWNNTPPSLKSIGSSFMLQLKRNLMQIQLALAPGTPIVASHL
ncbi:hypothetical protein EVAR_16426_1 [Eumeta japonica]|uniref:Uncharacterized protein n=1 Tax=Eumeta variegata TaxID=151549 RepID=A0A4C1ULJ7_EUMVA|nr:hypothetical protein EVAR_16426_1 [Eumeta japonica]